MADRSGNVAVIFALATPIFLVLSAGGVSLYDAGRVNEKVQGALDAAVLAGVAASDEKKDQIKAAEQFFAAYSLPETAKIKSVKFKVQDDVLHGEVDGRMENAFVKVLPTPIQLRIKAAAVRQQIPVCILGLNNLDNGSFDMNGNPVLNAEHCAVQANSNDNRAMTQEGNPKAKAGRFGVFGGYTGEGYFPLPVSASPKIHDPYQSMSFPEHEECDSTKKGLVLKESTTLDPGTYCGGITIQGSDVKVKLKPGIYVMVDGSFYLNSQANASGEKVMIAFTGEDSTLRVWGGSSLNLTSPDSGKYANMQFFQDRKSQSGNGMWVSIGGNSGNKSSMTYDGVAYFPTQNMWIFGNADVKANSPTQVMVADKIWLQGSAEVTVTSKNTRGIPVTGPMQFAQDARLVR